MKRLSIVIYFLFSLMAISVWADLNKDLFKAVKKGDKEKVVKLIKKGANVNVNDIRGDTPLHDSARGGYLKVVKLLIEKGANVNAKDKRGRTPLDRTSNIKIRKLIKKAGGKHGKKSSEEETNESRKPGENRV